MRIARRTLPERSQQRARRLLALRNRIREQICDAECLLAALDDYCREHPDDKPCTANDPNWRAQIISQRDGLQAMLGAIDERVKLLRQHDDQS
jgi:hypothetical protein